MSDDDNRFELRGEQFSERTLTFSTRPNRVVLTITASGEFKLGPDATVDEAAQAIVDIATRLFREQREADGDEWKR